MNMPATVSLSGPAFSFLLYENTKCRFQQEGFLLGEIVHKETKSITDNDQQQINIRSTIKINSVMPCPQSHYFYNGIGKLDENKIRNFLGNQFNKTVAWYKYQKIPTAKFTFRDRIIHRQLCELFDIKPELFTCCILSNEISENSSTHLLSQEFIRCHSLGCDKLQLNIPNLSEPNNTYKNSEQSSESFNKIIDGLKIDTKNTQGLVVINKISNALQKHVDCLVKDISKSEKQLHELEEEIKQIEIHRKVVKTKNNTLINTEQEKKKRASITDTMPTEESSSDVKRMVTNKKQATPAKNRGRKRGTTKEASQNSKTEQN